MATRIRKNIQQTPKVNGNVRVTRRQSLSAAAQKDGDSSSELSSGGSDAEDAAESDDGGDLTELDSDVDLTESELSSAQSDEDDDEEDEGEDDDMEDEIKEEEEEFIIQDLARRKDKISTMSRRKTNRKDGEKLQLDATSEGVGPDDATTGDPFPDDASGSLSPETLHQLGLDELFEGPNGFHSSSEPSFTDFFDSDSEDGTVDGIELDARSDDQQLTTDDEDSESDISLLDDEALMNTTFFGDALAAGASTQVAPGVDHVPQNADIPLLVIEDLDGRLIYARAGDGEAVFGSDGEFEFVDDSEDESDYYNSGIEDFDDDAIYNAAGSNGWKRARTFDDDDDETDEGDTTDELPNEDMPFPRLLVGSVAPHGGRNARRARAIAARSRRMASRRQSVSIKSRKQSDASAIGKPLASTTTSSLGDGLQDVDFSISTEDLARDPQATLEAAAATLGLTVNEVAQLVIGINTGDENNKAQNPASAHATPVMNNGLSLPHVSTPEHRIAMVPPQMGSFIPTSSKSVHRAVIDGASQAPSPFSARYGTQRKGLAGRKRQLSTPTSSAKRARHQRSRTVDNQGSALLTESDVDFGAAASSVNEEQESPVDGDEMGLDEVMDAALLWRGTHSSSPPPMLPPSSDDKGKQSPTTKAQNRAGSNGGGSKGADGLNLNAVARWHRIPMAAFREGQVSGSHHHPLGSFLLARSQAGQNGKGRGSHLHSRHEHSPFRGRARGASIHLNEAPKVLSGNAFMVSPVLWPTRPGSNTTTTTTGSAYDAHKIESGHSTMQNGNEQVSSSRKMTTRREKRERKARKAALKAALLAGTFQEAPGSVTSAMQSPMPDSNLPELDFTGPSPNTSSPDNAMLPSGTVKQLNGETKTPIAAHVSLTPPTDAFAPLSDQALAQHNESDPSLSVQHQPASSTISSHQQPPSSVYGMPLHSPLFGSVLNPLNLGFRDDLDDRDEEGNILSI